MDFIFPYIGNVIIPTDYIIVFRGVEKNTNQEPCLWNVHYPLVSSNVAGKSSVNGGFHRSIFSIATFDYQRVYTLI